MDNLYSLALDGTLLLGAVVLVMAAFAIGSRWYSTRGQGHASRLRRRMQNALEAYLGQGKSLEQTAPLLATDRKLALGILLGVASERGIAVQQQLRPLFEHFDFARSELDALGRRDFVRRVRAANHLGYIGGKVAVAALLGALQDEQLEVRLAAAQALVQLGCVEAILPILEALDVPGRWSQQRATELLYRLGPVAVPTLQHFLVSARAQAAPTMRVVAINVVGLLATPAASALICDNLHSEDCETRVAAARALGGIGDPAALGALMTALDDAAWEVRSQAAKSLGKLVPGAEQNAALLLALERALSDRAWWVRYNAAQALADLGACGLQSLQRASTTAVDPFARDISRQMLEEHDTLGAPVPA